MKKHLLYLTLLLATLATTALPVCAQEMAPVTIEHISDSVFSRMLGRSYPEGCRVPRTDLRYLRVLHYDAEGQVQQGELVCNKRIATDLADIFRQLYEARYPIERMRLIDDYEADDERSMAANNTSCFCYRSVAGSTKLSKHAQGLAVDVNPLYNPCVKTDRNGHQRVQPAAGKPYADRQLPSPYRLTTDDLCYRLFKAHGFAWGGSWRSLKDYQHFEK